eukprot:TRINITY_DN41932_c0_g1_i1.p1 TRINITY_DN41932_c0_g1~~TRINITY_DN41932_c0_g1_i1.p1  ORF type:complete len:235 (+),score=44.06 TRINITY_DN41932_c0_g1_i1:67-771(+)
MASPPPAKRYKLSYFDCRGRAELTRILFAYGGIDYEDDRVKRADMAELKAKGVLPFGQFPVLSIDGGPCYSQSYAIAKYVAKIVGLMPADPEAQLACDMIILTTEDVRSKIIPIRYSGKVGDERLALYRNFYENVLPGFLANFEKQLAGRKNFVGDSLSIADIAVFNMCLYLTFPCCEVQAADAAAKQQQETCLDGFPGIQALKEQVGCIPGIKNWLDARPQQEHDNVVTMTGK